MDYEALFTKMIQSILSRSETKEAYKNFGGKDPMDYNSIVRIIHNKCLERVDLVKNPRQYEPWFEDDQGKKHTVPDVFGLTDAEGEALTKYVKDPANTVEVKLGINKVIIIQTS